MTLPVPEWASRAGRRLEVLLSHCDWARCHLLIESLRTEQVGRLEQLTTEQWLDEPLSEIPQVQIRVVNLLERVLGVVTVRELIDRWRMRPIRLRQFGRGARAELIRRLQEVGIDVELLVGRPLLNEGFGEEPQEELR